MILYRIYFIIKLNTNIFIHSIQTILRFSSLSACIYHAISSQNWLLISLKLHISCNCIANFNQHCSYTAWISLNKLSGTVTWHRLCKLILMLLLCIFCRWWWNEQLLRKWKRFKPQPLLRWQFWRFYKQICSR